jgi:hypothetical protein
VRSPDPVDEPAAYQAHLLGALGDEDPGDAQAETVDAMRVLVREAGADLRSRPAFTEWSVIECIGHIVDAELVASARYRWIVAHDEPPLPGYDQERWVERLRHREDDPDRLVALFGALRAANLELWARSSGQDRARVGLHEERGPESYDLTFRLVAGHDRIHLAQARAALASVRAEAMPSA